MNFFTYEVLTWDESGTVTKREFNTQLESKCFFDLNVDDEDMICVQQIKITNGEEREIIREYNK